MFEKTPTTLLDRLGLAIITAIAIRTSITAYSTVVTPFCRLRFASEIESVIFLFSIVSLDSEYVAPYHLALLHLGLGQEELALDRLEQDTAESSPFGVWLPVEPRLDTLRSNSRFQAILRNMFSDAAVASGRKKKK